MGSSYVKTYVYLLYLAEFFWKWEIYPKKIVETMKTYPIFS
jgi:hypothetical protein